VPRPEWLTLPNAVSLGRLGGAPAFAALSLTGRPEAALIVFGVAAFTDVVDGLLARLLDQRSRVGALLDPVADKVLGFTGLVLLVAHHGLPAWLLGLVLVRDGLMVFGAVVVRRKRLEIPTSPSRIGKYASFTLSLAVLLALAERTSYAPPALHGYTAALGLIAALCIAISTLQYYARFGYLFFAPPREPTSNRPSQPR
jgi:cardiolipin synthase